MKKRLLLILCLFFTSQTKAQRNYVVTDSTSLFINTYPVLPDAHYTFNKIISDTTLVYKPDSLKASISDNYWVRINVYNPYPDDVNYLIYLTPTLKYTLYFFNKQQNKWISTQAGLATASNYREPGTISVIFSKYATHTLYFKINLHDVKQYKYGLKPVIILNKKALVNNDDELLLYFTAICCIAIFSFISYNLYLYLNLKDKAYLYFVMLQVGSVVFLLAANRYFNILLPFRLYNIRLISNMSVYIYDINKLFQHIGVLIIISGLIQFTRAYLRTMDLMPGFDKLLRFLLYGYILLETIPGLITISGLFYLDYYTIVFDNLYIQFTFLAIVITGITAYRRRIRAAKYFLMANVLPLIFAAGASVYAILKHAVSPVLSELAILSQILTFGVALVARIKLVTEELNAKRLEAVRLEAYIQITENQRLLMEQENKLIVNAINAEKNRNDLLQQKLEANQREMIGNNVYMYQKNTLLAELTKQIKDIDQLYPHLKSESLDNIQSTLKDNQYLDAEWDKFKLHFEQVHPRFFNDLKTKHPTLTNNDLRFCAYLHIHLSTKEIAALLNIVPASVKQAKARLNKKMNGQLSNSL